MILRNGKICLIDFGLSFYDNSLEAQGVDVHVYFQTLESTHDHAKELMEAFEIGYMRTIPRRGCTKKSIGDQSQRKVPLNNIGILNPQAYRFSYANWG